MPVKLVCTDVDGTLLDSDHNVREDTVKAIHEMLDYGIDVVVCTGRGNGQWLRDLRSTVGRDCTIGKPAVLRHGRLVLDKEGETLETTTLKHEVLKRLVQEVGHDMVVAHDTNGRTMLRDHDQKLLDMLAHFGNTDTEIIGDEFDRLGLPDERQVFGLEFAFPENVQENIPAIRKKVETLLEGDAVVLSAVPSFLEVVAAGANKATGIKRIFEMLGHVPHETLAIGDGENDVEMLQHIRENGGVAVAMGNAVAKLKDHAEHHVSSNNDGGWAMAMEQHVLPHYRQAK
ncbi:Sugar phosphatase YidA [Diplonema papillatum]|nr:Sugar phosphatase YidA [Diplonema papillatum]KAJ9456368.1 Sugar phosphatase YidA [Diplonema papillatum]